MNREEDRLVWGTACQCVSQAKHLPTPSEEPRKEDNQEGWGKIMPTPPPQEKELHAK